jgi:heavy metal translocating P-type ATPase
MSASPTIEKSVTNPPQFGETPKSAEPDPSAEHEEHGHGLEWTELVRIAFVALAAAAVWFRLWEPFAHLSVIGIGATLIGGYPIFKEAFENIIQRKMTMELSMTIALVAALVIGEFFTALIITLFVLVAEVLEGLNVSRGRRAIQNLLEFLPRIATIRRAGQVTSTEVSEIQRGETIIVKPGELLPVDGVVVSGRSFVDQAAITGESMPIEKMRGSAVYAGTINQSGSLEVTAERLGRDTTFGKIIEVVEQAEHARAPIQKTADRLAGYLVYFALAAAVLTFVLTRNIRSTISVVIVAGACGIAAGTPLAVLGAIGRAARQGAIVKGGLYLEALAAIDTVVLDKTGTLTYGVPKIQEVVPTEGWSERHVLSAAAVAERRSEHPVARAILNRTEELGLPTLEPESFGYTPGKGVAATCENDEILVGSHAFISEMCPDALYQNGQPADGMSGLYVVRSGCLLGTIQVADVLRAEAKGAVKSLKELGLGVILLSGDAQAVTTTVGRALHVDESVGDLMPEAKARWISGLRQNGRKVAMLGDGINDAPALTHANVGIAMGTGTDVARESADIVLIGNDLSKLVETIRIAKRCHSIIMQNFTGTLVVDSIGVGLAAFGFLNPLLAAFIHVSSELLFILNSTRLLPAMATPVQRGP